MTDDATIPHELDVARSIASGDLTSPQRIGDLSLYAMRVSGTGVSYRKGLDEYVWRDPAVYLSQDMIDRCAGLPVIWEHPPKSMLNSEEFANRVVGGVMFSGGRQQRYRAAPPFRDLAPSRGQSRRARCRGSRPDALAQKGKIPARRMRAAYDCVHKQGCV
jgi:hypothetical protein